MKSIFRYNKMYAYINVLMLVLVFVSMSPLYVFLYSLFREITLPMIVASTLYPALGLILSRRALSGIIRSVVILDDVGVTFTETGIITIRWKDINQVKYIKWSILHSGPYVKITGKDLNTGNEKNIIIDIHRKGFKQAWQELGKRITNENCDLHLPDQLIQLMATD